MRQMTVFLFVLSQEGQSDSRRAESMKYWTAKAVKDLESKLLKDSVSGGLCFVGGDGTKLFVFVHPLRQGGAIASFHRFC